MRKGVMISALCVLTAVVAAGTAAAAPPPENTAPPAISGTEREGSTLTASRGSWTNNPTSFTFRWQRCATDGTGCVDIAGADDNTYTLTRADVGRTVRVVVTAANADGRDVAASNPTDVVASRNAPRNTVRPDVTGDATVGEELTVSNGTWTPTPASYAYQWQRCDTDGTNCLNIAGATGRSYGIRTIDVGNRLRALVTARTAAGEQATAPSSLSDVVQSNVPLPPPRAANRAPTIQFISLRRTGVRVYARFRVCDDSVGRITVIQRDQKARAPAYTRRFAVRTFASCGTFSRSWIPVKRFRTPGRHVITLRAVDPSRRLSRLVSRSIFRR